MKIRVHEKKKLPRVLKDMLKSTDTPWIPSLHEHFAGEAEILLKPRPTSTEFETKLREVTALTKKCRISFRLQKKDVLDLNAGGKGTFQKKEF